MRDGCYPTTRPQCWVCEGGLRRLQTSQEGNLNEKVKTRMPSLQVLFIALQNRSGALVTVEFVRTIMLILAKPLCFILFYSHSNSMSVIWPVDKTYHYLHFIEEKTGVEKLFTQGQATSTWLSWDSSPNCLTGRASIPHNGCLVVLSEIGNHGFHFQGGLIWVNSLFLPAALSFFVFPGEWIWLR